MATGNGAATAERNAEAPRGRLVAGNSFTNPIYSAQSCWGINQLTVNTYTWDNELCLTIRNGQESLDIIISPECANSLVTALIAAGYGTAAKPQQQPTPPAYHWLGSDAENCNDH